MTQLAITFGRRCVAYDPDPPRRFRDGTPWPKLPGLNPCGCPECVALDSPEAARRRVKKADERERRRWARLQRGAA